MMSYFLYLILYSKFLAFKLVHPEVVKAGVFHFTRDFCFKLLMTLRERFQMSFYRHIGPPLRRRDIKARNRPYCHPAHR